MASLATSVEVTFFVPKIGAIKETYRLDEKAALQAWEANASAYPSQAVERSEELSDEAAEIFRQRKAAASAAARAEAINLRQSIKHG